MSSTYLPKQDNPDESHHDGDSGEESEYPDSGYAGSSYNGDSLAAAGTSTDNNDYSKNSLSTLKPDLITNSKGSSLRRLSIASRMQARTQISQAQYNSNRVALGRAIELVRGMLRELNEINNTCGIYYSNQSDTGNGQNGFQVLKLDLKFGHSGEEVVHSLEKSSVTSLFENRITQIIKHLNSLQERINDTASKVLITGDVNSGKSTFCNALLGRKILPEDQQPCTNVFCEVLDCRDNSGAEEVHAVPIGQKYNRLNGSTYDVFKLSDLEDLVLQNDKYSLLKVYVDEHRPPGRSLLRNGVADIALIDAPGLNRDSYQTTQLFSRQEEIDLVVFVVSAENHFTLSAKEFIGAAAHEKSFIFIVVNRFDAIRDKSRCMRRILDQVADMSPETHKDARDFVHFVGEPSTSSSPGGGGGGGDDGGDDYDDTNNADDADNPFRNLEISLRNFVLEKRSLSKLAPAKTYLNNILLDLERLAEVNIEYSAKRREKYEKSLDEITPLLEKTVSDSVRVSEKVDKDIEDVSQEVHDYTVRTIGRVLQQTSEPASVKYTSLFDVYDYAVATRAAIIQRIQDSVIHCEEHARTKTVISVNSIKSLGIMHLGEQPAFMKVFNDSAMFSRRRDNLARSINAELSLSDFVSISVPIPQNWFAWGNTAIEAGKEQQQLELASVGNALTLASVVGGGQMILQSAWIKHAIRAIGIIDYQTAKKLFVPTLIALTAYGVYHVVSEMPRTVSRNVSRKIASEVEQLGYIHSNALRISRECRKVLKYPAQDIKASFQISIEQHAHECDDYNKSLQESEAAFSYFSNLHKDAAEQRAQVAGCELELPDV